MFIKRHFSTILLISFAAYTLILFKNGDLTLYIHPRYVVFNSIMAVFAIIILAVALRARKEASHDHKKTSVKRKIFSLSSLASVVIIIAFIVPPTSLSSQAIDNRPLNTTSNDNSSKLTGCPPADANTLQQWVYDINSYDLDCFTNKKVDLIGFVLPDASEQLRDDEFYLARVVVSCCVIDGRPFALPAQWGNTEPLARDTWLRVQGTLTISERNDQPFVLIEETVISPVEDPREPYEFFGQDNSEPATEIQPINPIN